MELTPKEIGGLIASILSNTEKTIRTYEFDAEIIEYPASAFKSCVFLFSTIMMWEMWNLQEKEDIDMKDRVNMATKLGEDIRQLVKTYTGLDTFNFYQNEKTREKEA